MEHVRNYVEFGIALLLFVQITIVCLSPLNLSTLIDLYLAKLPSFRLTSFIMWAHLSLTDFKAKQKYQAKMLAYYTPPYTLLL